MNKYIFVVGLLCASSSMAVITDTPEYSGSKNVTIRIYRPSSTKQPEVVQEEAQVKKAKTPKEINDETYNLLENKVNNNQITIPQEERKKKKGFFRQLGQVFESSSEPLLFQHALSQLKANIKEDGSLNPENQWLARGTLSKYNLKLIEEYNKLRQDVVKKYSEDK